MKRVSGRRSFLASSGAAPSLGVSWLAGFRRAIRRWYAGNRRQFPWREMRQPWPTLIAEVLLRQTRASTVARVYGGFLERWPTPQALAAARPAEVTTAIAPLGLGYRAAELVAIARQVVERFGGDVPADRKKLMAIPSVGDYTASAVLSHGFGKGEPTVDTNIVRQIQQPPGENSLFMEALPWHS